MIIQKTTLEEVLRNREKRMHAQQDLIQRYQRPILSCTMNIPGDVKRTPLIDFVFRQKMGEVRCEFGGEIIAEKRQCEVTGPEAFFVVDASPTDLKERAVTIESQSRVGRLLDLDVIDTDGTKRSRMQPRSCLVCGGPVTFCSRSRAHGLAAVKSAAWDILTAYAEAQLADLAVDALKREAVLTPKPGLVDGNNNGAHRDMDLGLLLSSADSLRLYFQFCVDVGFREAPDISKLVNAGLEAEKTMLSRTGGVNTHKGAVYAMGLFLCGVAKYFKQGGDPFAHSAFFAAVQAEASAGERSSHGRIVQAKYLAGGAREEAMNGFPTARKGAAALTESQGDELYALLKILEGIRDTNLLYRGGMDALDYVQAQARRILAMDPERRKDALLEMDQECIRLNISPGGAADMLALALFIERTVPELI
ncbi:MAG TPA: citrate lyase holo-[acyl-carrier protein] synthase [Anaerovoracaceae bacterium]|nr:citrate lyase holo-[acyl-carrier protein] synthase [Anaerovoracaceae bacterium]